MGKTAGKLTLAIVLVVASMVMGAFFSSQSHPAGDDIGQAEVQKTTKTATASFTPTETIPPYTPLPTLTPSQTLLPPPTFEPPTETPSPTPIPSTTPTPTPELNISIPGLNGAETPTPSTTPGCVPRKDWKLTYTVVFNDTLSGIASKYGTWVDDLVAGNCLKDKNLIVVGQVLRVPGTTQPVEPEVACVPWDVQTPFNGSVNVPADGSITFNWRGPLAPINLIRIFRPDGSKYEDVIELRQNETINLNENLAQGGTYTWYVYPLDHNFQQVQCLEGGPWTFYKPQSSPPTATPAATRSVP